jgi:hypothetical protein
MPKSRVFSVTKPKDNRPNNFRGQLKHGLVRPTKKRKEQASIARKVNQKRRNEVTRIMQMVEATGSYAEVAKVLKVHRSSIMRSVRLGRSLGIRW